METEKPSKGRSKKLIAIVLVCIIIVAVASLIAFTRFPPSDGDGEPEPGYLLRLNYNVGEKMTYNMKTTLKTEGEDVTGEVLYEMEILNSDGENYTIKQTISDKESGLSYTATVKMNQTGHVVEYLECNAEYLGSSFALAGVPTFGDNFPFEEVKLGESWETAIDIEMPELDILDMDFSGTRKYTLSKVTNETLKLEYETTVTMTRINDIATADVSGTIYLDAVTCSLVEATYFESIKVVAQGQTAEAEVIVHCWLIS